MDFESKKTALFTKAGELGHEFGAEAAIMIISGDQRSVNTLTTSDFVGKYAKCAETENPPTFHQFRLEDSDVLEPLEIVFRRMNARDVRESRVRALDAMICDMDTDKLAGAEKQLKDRLRSIQDRKMQMMIHQLQHYKAREEQLVQENVKLKRKVEEIQGLLPSITTNRGPGPASNFGPQVNESLPPTSTSAAAQLATDNLDTNLSLPDRV